jgi:hypothetical protein
LAGISGSISWFSSPQEGFSVDQLELLKTQMLECFQLVIQGLVIEKALADEPQSNNVNVLFWEEQLVFLFYSDSIAEPEQYWFESRRKIFSFQYSRHALNS